MDVKWIKIVTDIFDDEKILLLESMPDGDAMIVCWFKLLCLAGKQNNHGVFTLNDRIAFTDEMLATIFRRPLNTVRLALGTFEEFGMVERIEGVITIPNWDKHQSLDAYERRKEADRLRKQQQRAAQKLLVCGQSADTSADVRTVDIDKDIDKEVDKDNKRIFHAPSKDEVEEYCKSRNNGIDAQHFIDYYAARGWMVGKTKMKDWKAAIRTWEHRHKENSDARTDRSQSTSGIRYSNE